MQNANKLGQAISGLLLTMDVLVFVPSKSANSIGGGHCTWCHLAF
jgi:hypothetical protein